MRTVAPKPHQPRRHAASGRARSRRRTPGRQPAELLLQLQRTIGNQAVQRLLQPQPGPLGQPAVPSSVQEVVASPGQPLAVATRAFMEPRFGQDFSQVRVHVDAKAARSAAAMRARAYTVGQHIVLGQAQPSPETAAGRHLWAHELAHVGQQQSFAPQNDACADGDSSAEGEAERAAAAVAQGDDVAVLRERRVGAIQLQPDADVKPTLPTLIKTRRGNTARIEDAYGAGSLDETQWRTLLDSAEQALTKGQREAATRTYLTLYADVAKLAQATRVVSASGVIHVVTGGKSNCTDARPGLNFSLRDQAGWGANATTALVDESGKFGVKLSRRGTPQPQVAIVLTRSVFVPDKEQALGRLRHEMVQAEHFAEDAANAFLSNPRDTSEPELTSAANTELLGYTEGFMTMFHLTQPAPTSPEHPAFVQLLGVLDVGGGDVLPWAQADPTVRAEALGRLQEYYCHALDAPHREALTGWVRAHLTAARRDRLVISQSSKDLFAPAEVYSPGGVDESTLKVLQREGGNPLGASIRMKRREEDFFGGLQRIITSNCKGLTLPSMKL